ncbi:MAG: hypothetical protein ACK53L_13535, partial [Pirellulaceae bacterium]
VNTLFTSWLGKTFHKITPLFVIGMLLVGIGMAGVLSYKPHRAPKPATTSAAESSIQPTLATVRLVSTTAAEQAKDAEAQPVHTAPSRTNSDLLVTLSIVMAVVCWGSYGPVLHLGQMKMGGSRLRPFCCVGLAYFFIAVAVPL